MNFEFLHGRRSPGPEEQGDEAQREDLKELEAHRATRSWSSILGGILTLAGAAVVVVVTMVDTVPFAGFAVISSKLVIFDKHHPMISFGTMVEWWGPILLLLVGVVLALASKRLKTVAGALIMGAAGVLLFRFAGMLAVEFGFPMYRRSVPAGIYFGLTGSAVALVGGLIALLTGRTKA